MNTSKMSTRKQIIDNNNLLASKMELSIECPEMNSIRKSYMLLWIHSSGLPPQCTHIKTDLAIVCNIAILSLKIWLKSGRDIELRESIDIYLKVLERVFQCHHENIEECSSCNEGFVIDCIRKIEFFKYISERIITSDDIDISELFTLKRKCIRGDSSLHPFDEAYFSVYQCYMEERFEECFSQLHSKSSFYNSSDNACLNLLMGNCLERMGKYHLSLYYYSQCLNDSNTCIPAMKNSAVIFEKLQNTAAELEMRELIVKVLKEKNDNDLRKRIYLVNGRLSSQCYTNQEQEGLLIASFDLGRRALDFSKYSVAAEHLQIVVDNSVQRQLLPPSLPPVSTILLLLYKAHKNAGNIENAHHILDKLHTLFSSHTSITGLTGFNKCVLLCQILWLKGNSLLSNGRAKAAKNILITCLSCVDHMICCYDTQLIEFKVMINVGIIRAM